MNLEHKTHINQIQSKNTTRKKVFVGLSGGVDSSVAAALLLQEGYAVEGVYLLGYQPPFMVCPAADDRADALSVATHLGIPFHTLDLSVEYKKEVVDYLFAEYKAGRTPNPDIMCNQHIKFGAFYRWAVGQGANYIATGHYARGPQAPAHNAVDTLEAPPMPNSPMVVPHSPLSLSVDLEKDQTYFLWAISPEALSHTLFPIGDYQKSHVRELAREFGLPTATKKDSQGVCFLGKIDMAQFLAQEIPRLRGTVLSENGEIIGYHFGATFITLGQRHGFTVTKKTPTSAPLYVIAKNNTENTITVSPNVHVRKEDEKTVSIEKTNWFARPPQIGLRYLARARHRQKLFAVTPTKVSETRATFTVLEENNGPFAPGQSFVVYEGDECYGGGVIAQLQ